MFPKFLEDSFKAVNQKHLDVQRISECSFEDDSSMFFNNCFSLKNQILIEKNQYIDFLSHPEYFTHLENLQNNKIAEILDKCSHPERKSLLPYLVKFIRYTDFLKKSEREKNTPGSSQSDFKYTSNNSDINPNFLKSKSIDPEKLNHYNQLFSKLNKTKIINLDNVSNEVVMLYLDNKNKDQKDFNKIDSILTPSNIDIHYFNSLNQTIYDDAQSPENSKHRSKYQPKVLTMNFNLEQSKPASFVTLNNKTSYVEGGNKYASLNLRYDKLSQAKYILKNENGSSARLKTSDHVIEPYSSLNQLPEDENKSESEQPKENHKINLRIVNTDLCIGNNNSPTSCSNKLVNKINNFYIYYHTVKRNVNPSSHRRQYSKSIQYFENFIKFIKIL